MTIAKSLTRRSLLIRTLQSAVTLGAGAAALTLLGQSNSGKSVRDLVPAGFDLTPNDVCTLTCQQTLGPCHYDPDLVRRDVTEGKNGLPTLMGFLVVNADTCQPVENAAVEIWHTDANGVYSAPIAAMCNAGDAVARTQTFLRGIQTTGSDGWAYFNTIYPGWYSGRTPHVHAMVTLNNVQNVVTQFYFPDTMSDWIYRNHPLYTHRPNRNTTNTSDGVIGGNTNRVVPYLFNSKLINNQSLVALKVIAIRASRTTCNA